MYHWVTRRNCFYKYEDTWVTNHKNNHTYCNMCVTDQETYAHVQQQLGHQSQSISIVRKLRRPAATTTFMNGDER